MTAAKEPSSFAFAIYLNGSDVGMSFRTRVAACESADTLARHGYRNIVIVDRYTGQAVDSAAARNRLN